MKILIVGNGGREFAIAKKIMEQNPETIIYFAEGNGATKSIGINTGISQTDTANLIKFVQDEKISFTIVGPELPLVDGIVDAFERANLKIFGPNKQGAKLEASKDFTKKILLDAKIPTAEYKTFTDPKLAID